MQMLPEGQKASIDVLWEDQQRINEFSRLNSRLDNFDREVQAHKDEKEFLDDVAMELELVDEDDSVQYKIGDTFVFLKQPEVLERLEKDSDRVSSELDRLETQVSDTKDRMSELKKHLYAKFGTAINLETD